MKRKMYGREREPFMPLTETPPTDRTVAMELQLIRRAVRRLCSHPDNHAAIKALRDLQSDIEQALCRPNPTTPTLNPADKQYVKSLHPNLL